MPLTHFLSIIVFVIAAAGITVIGIQALDLPLWLMGIVALVASVTLRGTLWR